MVSRQLTKLVLAAIVALGATTLACHAADEDWVMIAKWSPRGNEPAPTLLFDTKHIESDKDFRTIYVMMDYDRPTNGEASGFMLSRIDQIRIDCATSTSEERRLTEFADHMGHGAQVFDRIYSDRELQTKPILENSPLRQLKQRACATPTA
jgi:hypothetical protein